MLAPLSSLPCPHQASLWLNAEVSETESPVAPGTASWPLCRQRAGNPEIAGQRRKSGADGLYNRSLLKALVWTVAVVVLGVLGQDAAQFLLAEDQHVIEALAAKRPREPLRERVRLRRPGPASWASPCPWWLRPVLWCLTYWAMTTRACRSPAMSIRSVHSALAVRAVTAHALAGLPAVL
jgi:hypothetical protein